MIKAAEDKYNEKLAVWERDIKGSFKINPDFDYDSVWRNNRQDIYTESKRLKRCLDKIKINRDSILI